MGYAPGTGTGFVSVGDYLDANRGTLANERDQIGQGVDQQIQAAQGAAGTAVPSDWSYYATSPGGIRFYGDPRGGMHDATTAPGYGDALARATAANDQISALGTQGGIADYFKQHYGDTNSQAGLDAGLLGGGIHRDPFDLNAYLDAHHTLANPPVPKDPRDREPKPPGQVNPTPTDPGYLTAPRGHDRR